MRGPITLRQWLSDSGDYLIETVVENGRDTMFTVIRMEELSEGTVLTTCYDPEQGDNAEFETLDEAITFVESQENT